MPIYRIAELNIQIEPLYKQTQQRLSDYLCDSASADFDASVTRKSVTDFRELHPENTPPYLTEGALVLTNICQTVLREYNGCFFHSSSLMVDGQAYLFTALSGTGKSTHTALWRRRFGDRVTMINDDKPIIRFVGGEYRVYSTPWMGKSEIGANLSAPIKAIYVLQRAAQNSAERVKVSAVFRQLLEATLVPNESENMHKLLTFFDGLFSSVPLFLLKCNMDEEAAQVAYDAAKEIK